MNSTPEQRGPRLSVEELRVAAAEVRALSLVDIFAAGSGHPGGTLSIMDIAAALYLRVLNHDPKDPSWPDRDRVFWSAGHKAPALYIALGKPGYFPPEDTVPLRLDRGGVEDRFGLSGKPWELMQAFGLTAEHIATRVLRLHERGQR